MISARRPLLLLLGVVIVLALVSPAGGHEDDPALLDHWRTHVHLLFQWAHLVAFALWLGGTAAALCVPAVDVRRLLPLLWLGLAVQVVTGAYQMGSWTPSPSSPIRGGWR